MMKEKGIVSLLPVVVVGGIITLVVVMIPGLANSILSTLSGMSSGCQVAPFDPNCVCGDEFDKKPYTWTGLPKYKCEPIPGNLYINVYQTGWEDVAVQTVRDRLSSGCPNCDLSCSDGVVSTAVGIIETGEVVINIECCIYTEMWNNVPLCTTNPWRVQFSAYDGHLDPITGGYCVYDNIRCEI